ncbi:hypothetical protein N4T20_09200 [Flavobacterium sp. TR2]|uniref:hypothetical protein n=1 Tax=Flavobacterium sp. TR2 TaxID=2977321 RepID=UPI0021B0E8F1|nr:hypothetical protein [Flavobacterium sp. TR2]UWY30104.1 hypothetical protein N4T20_09200 [Flavobacterium sp. TR2]
MELTTNQKEKIQTAFQNGSFDFNKEIQNLVDEGFSKEEAASTIKVEIDKYKQELFEQKMRSESQEEKQKIAVIIVALIGVIKPISNITSPVWLIISIILAGFVGYWAYEEKPFTGITGSICMVTTLPVTYNWYTSGRESIINIELLIPLAISMGLSFLIGWIIVKLT